MQGPFCDTLRSNFELLITIITILAILTILWCYKMSVKYVGYDQCIVLLFSTWEGARVLNNYCCLLYFWHILLQFYMIRPIVLLLIMKLGIPCLCCPAKVSSWKWFKYEFITHTCLYPQNFQSWQSTNDFGQLFPQFGQYLSYYNRTSWFNIFQIGPNLMFSYAR